MGKVGKKIKRYSNLRKNVVNWPEYLWKKTVGFSDHFVFDVVGLGKIKVHKETMGPFRENFFDEVYLTNIPGEIFDKTELTVVDIGANIGFFSLSFLSKYPQTRIVAFEPHPYCYGVLENYQLAFPEFNFDIFQQAVGRFDSTLTLKTSNLDGFATMSSIFENESNTHHFEVESIKLDTAIKNQDLDEIDLLKIDCEGSEYAILYNSSPEVFDKIRAISIETHEGSNQNESFQMLDQFIKSKGYNTFARNEGKTGYIWAWR